MCVDFSSISVENSEDTRFREVPVGGIFFLIFDKDREHLGKGAFIKTESGFVGLTGRKFRIGHSYTTYDLMWGVNSDVLYCKTPLLIFK